MGFSIENLAASALRRISQKNSRTVRRKFAAPKLPAAEVNRLTGKVWICGAAAENAMPRSVTDKFYAIAGHGPGRRIEGVHDPVTVRAMWLGCGEGGVLVVTADIIGLTNPDVQSFRQRILPFCHQIGCVAVHVCCSHSHAGFDTVGYWGKLPKTGRDPEYMEQLFSCMEEVCRKAYENRRAGTLLVGESHVPDAQHIRRQPKVAHDTLTRLRFLPKDGGREIWFLNFAAHPNTLGGENRLVSADYPYYLRKTIQEETNAEVLFAVGAIGAVDPGLYSDDRRERTRLQGEALARAALAMEEEETLAPSLSSLCQPFYYPVDNSVLNFLAMLGVMPCNKYPCETGELQMALRSEMSLLRLGKQQILLLPGELFPALAYGGYRDKNHSAANRPAADNPEPLTEMAGDEKLLIFGVSNDMTGYVVPPNEFVLHPTQPYLSTAVDRFGEKHYHETNSLGFLSAETIAEVFRALLRQMDA